MQKVFTFNFFVLVFFLAFISLLSSCENPLFVEATKLYEVSFETNGGTKIDSYHTDRIEKSPETSKAGFTFAGWYKNSSLTAKIESFPLKIESTTTLYAKWNQNYRVDFVTNGGSAVNETNSIETCLLENAPVTNKDGFEVVGWYLNAGFGGVPVSFPYQVNSPVTLYAKWAPVFKVTFVTNGGTAIAPKKTTALKVFPTSERSGYTLVAWYFDEELTENVSFPLELTQSMTLYARWKKNYTIDFESNGGTNLETVNTWCIEQRPEPIKTGLSFGGWYTSSDFAPSTKVTFPFYPNKDTTLYARWNHYDYIVTYELNGGYNHSENPDGFDKGNDAIQLHEPSKIGCEFLGWYDNTNFSGSAVTEIPANTNEDKSFYAKWKPIVYLIEYVLNGGTNDSKNSTSYTVETETFLLNAPSKIGYTFGGWYENAEFSGLARTEIEKGLVGNKKLFAKWTPMEYAISYNLNGGTNNEANPATYTIESETFSFSDASRNGYSFSGWYENADCIGERVTQISKGSYGAKNLYAKWDVITYSIEYVLNGGTFEKVNPSSYTAESETFPLNAPTKTGYNFDGWYESADFNGNSLSQISRGTFGNKVLYAKWTTESYTITYELNGGSLETANPSTYEMATETFILNEPVRIGYNFGGWYETANYTGERVTQIEKGSYGDKKLYAKWGVITYSIEYVLNGGMNNEVNPTSYTIEVETFSLNDPSKAGYDFAGWYENVEFEGNPITHIAKGSYNSKVLYAKWSPITYTITYNLNGGKFSGTCAKSYTYESSVILPIPRKNACAFEGWFDNQSFKGDVITEIPIGSSENKVFYAKWNFRGYYIIDYDLQGGSFISEAPSQYVNSFECEVIIPKKKGKTFIGWKNAGKSISSLSGEEDGDVHLVAQWKNPDIGDVVLNDGRLIEDKFFDSSSMSAVAVLFSVSDGYFGLGIRNSKNEKYAWCSKNAYLYSYRFDSTNVGISVGNQNNITYAPITSYFGDLDGSDNWNYICFLDENASKSAAEKYPAFNYVNNYKDFVSGDLYKDGWYLPSGKELYMIYTCVASLNSVLSKINGDLLMLDDYWSSSALIQVSSGAMELTLSKLDTSSFVHNLENARLKMNPYSSTLVSESYSRDCEYSVCAIRKFTW